MSLQECRAGFAKRRQSRELRAKFRDAGTGAWSRRLGRGIRDFGAWRLGSPRQKNLKRLSYCPVVGRRSPQKL